MKLIKKIPAAVLKFFSPKKGVEGVAAVWLEEKTFLKAVRCLKKEGLLFTAVTPYPVHGLEEAMHIPRSRIPWVTFVCGVTGCGFGLWFTWWVSAVSWPLIIGGKPFWSWPAFIPVIFELSILFAALGSIAALFYVCGLPRINPPVIDPDLSSHKFAVFVPLSDKNPRESLKTAFSRLDPEKVLDTEF